MKGFLVFLIVFISFEGFGQAGYNFVMWPYGPDDKILFSETIHVYHTSGDSLYNLAKSFVSKKFNGERDTISSTDYNRTVKCRGAFYLPVEVMGDRGKEYIGFTLTIACYMNAYRYTFTDFEHFAAAPEGSSGGALENDRAACGGALFPARYWNEEKTKAYYYIQTAIETMKEAMKKNAAS